MKKLKLTARQIYSTTNVVRIVFALVVLTACGTVIITGLVGQDGTAGERIVRLETKAESLAETDRRNARDIADLRKDVDDLKQTVSRITFIFPSILGAFSLLQIVMSFAKGKLVYEPSQTGRHRGSSG